MPFSVFIKRSDSHKAITINFGTKPEEVNVSEFKKKIEAKLCIKPDEQRLIFGTETLQDDKTLAEYGLADRSCVFLVHRAHGGGQGNSTQRQNTSSTANPVRRPSNTSASSNSNHTQRNASNLILGQRNTSIQSQSVSNAGNNDHLRAKPPSDVPVYDEDCIICISSPSIKMICGHFYCPTCLFTYSWNEANDGKMHVKCSVCEYSWRNVTIKRYGLFSDKEFNDLAKQLSLNVIKKSGVRECPVCEKYLERKDNTKARTRCPCCANANREAYFCFHCSLPWKSQPGAEECGNQECSKVPDGIKNAPMKTIVGVENCPSRRMCPSCGYALEHRHGCKQFTCKNCETKFCFICLRQQMCGAWQCGAWNDRCVPAPIQDTVPSRNT